MEKIKISVIIPIYNAGLYLEKCLRSIMNQSLKEIEIICVNDGSTDNSLEILKGLGKEDKRIKIINQINQGVSKARNEALKIAKGKYCLNIDSDDWVELKYLEDMYKLAEKENLDIVVSDYYKDYLDGKIKMKKGKKRSEKIIFNSKEYLQDFFYDGDAPAMWNKLFKTSLYKENNIFYPVDISLGEDLATIPRLIYFAKRIGYLKRAYYHYRENSKSITNTITGIKKCQIFKCFDLLKIFFEEQNEDYEELLYRYNIYHLNDFLFFKPAFDNKEYVEGYKNFLLFIRDKRLNENRDILNKINKVIVFFIKILILFPYKTTFLFINKTIILLKNIKNKLK